MLFTAESELHQRKDGNLLTDQVAMGDKYWLGNDLIVRFATNPIKLVQIATVKSTQ